MVIEIARTTPTCMYCGNPTKRGGKGEHIVPKAIGGALTLNDTSDKRVCPGCNSGVLSEVDRELCSRSFLSVVASQELDAHIWQAWDVDHSSGNLLVEAKPEWDGGFLSQLICYPQMTFERTGPDIRGDLEEIQHFGHEDFEKVFRKAIRQAFHKFSANEKGSLHFERIQSGVIHAGYRLAPRIFTRHSIAEIARNINDQSFILRFVTDADRRFALRSLSLLGEGRQCTKWTQRPGSTLPTISVFFDIGVTLRALIKLGLNLIAAYCHNTPVNHDTFRQAMRLILGEGQINPGLFNQMGFVRATDIQCIKDDGGGHSFRLVHMGGHWRVYSSFFGGRIGSFVLIPGPNYENWACADIVAPIKSRDWMFRKREIIQPFGVKVQWADSTEVAPSLKLQNSISAIRCFRM
jgi:hypothetical protein